MKQATPVRGALVAGSSLLEHVRDGVQALQGTHRALVDEPLRGVFADSIDIDEALRSGREQEFRWDYLLGIAATRRIVGLEPHTANNKEISVVIEKRKQALRQLRGHLRSGVTISEWFWVASGKVDFTPMDKARARLDQEGIQFVGKKLLVKRLAEHLEAAAPLPRKRPKKR